MNAAIANHRELEAKQTRLERRLWEGGSPVGSEMKDDQVLAFHRDLVSGKVN